MLALLKNHEGTTHCQGSLPERPDSLTCVVQLELQEQGAQWEVKGCTAYDSTGTKRPVAIGMVPAVFQTQTEALGGVVRLALKELTSEHPSLDITWQVVRWDRPWHSAIASMTESGQMKMTNTGERRTEQSSADLSMTN